MRAPTRHRSHRLRDPDWSSGFRFSVYSFLHFSILLLSHWRWGHDYNTLTYQPNRYIYCSGLVNRIDTLRSTQRRLRRFHFWYFVVPVAPTLSRYLASICILSVIHTSNKIYNFQLPFDNGPQEKDRERNGDVVFEHSMFHPPNEVASSILQ